MEKVLSALALSIYLVCCIPSAGAAERVCSGTVEFLDAENVLQFEDCKHVNGNIIINLNSLRSNAVSPAKLLLLSQVREIDGYLLIEGLNHSDITDMRFLRHLEVIHGHSTVEVLRREYSLVIQDNPYLQTLSLASLSRIDNGGVRIQGNPLLCLVDTLTIEDYLADSVSQRTRIGGYRFDCSGVHCHEQCNQTHGCWGTFPDECVRCRHYQYLQTCVENCNMSVSYPVEDSLQCQPLYLHPSSSTTLPSPSTTTSHITPASPSTLLQDIHAQSTTIVTISTTSPDEAGTSLYYIPLVLIIGIVFITALVVLAIKRQSREKKRKQSLLLIQHVQQDETCSKSDNSAKHDTSRLLDHTSVSLRRSRISLASSKSKVQQYETVGDRTGGQEVNTNTRKVSVTSTDSDSSTEQNFKSTSPPSTTCTEGIKVDYSSYQPLNCETASSQDNKQHHPHLPHTQGMERAQSTSPESDRTISACTEQTDSTYCGRYSLESDSEQLSSLFSNRRQSVNSVQFPPPPSIHIHRPTTMGGVYSTGHHRHHSNHFHSNSHRGSLTSSHGVGTSARTSRSGSQQFGSSSIAYGSSSTGYNSAVFDSKSSS